MWPGFIAEKYGPVIEAIYGGANNVDLQLSVTFEDGSESLIDAHKTIQEAA